MLVLGIDPGFTGAIALLDSATGRLLSVADMPTYKNKKGKVEIDHTTLFDLLNPGSETVTAVLEYVASRPNQSAQGTFRFGQGYGAIEMALAAHKIPVQYVTPAKWKSHFGLSKEKGVSRGFATQRFPSHAASFSRVKDDGRAEASLIALYGKEKLL